MSRQSKYSRNKHAQAADIGVLPGVADPARRVACRLDLELFLTTYFPHSTGLSPFGEQHKLAIKRIQIAILEGGLFNNIFPRGFAKTTIGENAAIWALAYGHRKFIPIFGADANAACGNIDSIKTELAENELLYADFPEMCHAIRALEGKPQRCASQTFIPGNVEGFEVSDTTKPELTRISWTADMIVLPTIMLPDGYSACSGGAITTRGIEAGARGMKYKRHDGTQQRPDFVMIDDPQTDQSADSATQTKKRLNVIQKSILRLGGHGNRLAVVMNATIIQPDDLVETMTDVSRFPAWQSQRIKMVNKFSDAHETLWLDKYATIRNTYDPDIIGDQQRAHRDATEFYKSNREAMDAGAEVSWVECYDRENEISAIQHAYNILIDDGEEVFASECQNDPKPKSEGTGQQLVASEIIRRLNHVQRGVVPSSCDKVTAFVDVQGEALFWVVAAWDSKSFSGHVIDYGTFPDQPTRQFELAKLRVKMSDVFKKSEYAEYGARVFASLNALKSKIVDRMWKREDGAEIPTSRVLIDYGYDPSADAVFSFCKQSRGIAIPSKGKGVGAKRAPFDQWKKREGETHGRAWKISSSVGRLVALFETNFWKSFVRDALFAPLASKTALYLYGDDSKHHGLIADHWAVEKYTTVSADGRSVDEWENPSNWFDQHWWDGIVGCAVAASMVGVQTPVQAGHRPAAARAITFAEAKKNRTVHRVNRGAA